MRQKVCKLWGREERAGRGRVSPPISRALWDCVGSPTEYKQLRAHCLTPGCIAPSIAEHPEKSMGSPLSPSDLIFQVAIGSRTSTDHCCPPEPKTAVPHCETVGGFTGESWEVPLRRQEGKTQVILRNAGRVALCREETDSESRERKGYPQNTK